MIYLIILVVLLTALLMFVSYKCLFFMKANDDLIEINNKHVETILQINMSVVDAYAKIKDADSKGVFESDDEVGYTFNSIKNVVYELNDYIENSCFVVEDEIN